MRDSKVYKVLRIIFLALAIMSLVFALARKVGLAAESPQLLPYQPIKTNLSDNTNIDPDSVLTQLQALGYLTSNSLVRYNSSNGNYSIVVIHFATAPYISTSTASAEYVNTSSANSYLASGSSIYIGNQNATDVYVSTFSYDSGTGRITFVGTSNYAYYTFKTISFSRCFYCVNDIYLASGELLFSATSSSGGSGANPEIDWGAIDQALNTTQLIADTVDSTWDNFTFWQRILTTLTQGFNNFVHIGQWMLNNLLSFFKPIFDSILNVLQWLVSFLTSLLSSIEDLLNTIIVHVVDGFDALLDSISDFYNGVVSAISDITDDIETFWSHLHEVYEWFYTHGLNSDHEWSFIVLFHYLFDFDSTTALADFQANKYGDFVLDVRDFFNTFIGSIINQNASSRVFFTVPIGTHFGSNVGDVEINFDWYASIRDNYLPYFMAFLYISVIWLFFKRLPDILRGVAGAESSFSDSLPYDTESKTYTNSGVYTSKTHVSNGGRSRVSFNSFKKF